MSDLDDGPANTRKRPRGVALLHAQHLSQLPTTSTKECHISTLSEQAPLRSPSSGARKVPEDPVCDSSSSSGDVEIQGEAMNLSDRNSSSESLSIASTSDSRSSRSDVNNANNEHDDSSSLGSASFSDSDDLSEGERLRLGKDMAELRLSKHNGPRSLRQPRKIAREEMMLHPTLAYESYLEDVEGCFVKIYRIDTRTWAHQVYDSEVKRKRRLVKSWTLVHKLSPRPGQSELLCSNCSDFDLHKTCVHVMYTKTKMAEAMVRIVTAGGFFRFHFYPIVY